MKIAFIGGGKMAEALLSRLTSHDRIVSDVDPKRLKFLQKKYQIKIAENNQAAFDAGEVVILAVKPQNMGDVAAKLALQLRNKKLIISIAAGIPLSYLQKKLPGFSIIRAMPNNPALVGAGITALARGKAVSSKQYADAEKIFKAVGEVVAVPEKRLDAVTGLSGSGPAYIYMALEGLSAGGEAAGLPKALSAKLALQTVLGAAQTAKQTGRSARELREMVTSPGGTTVEGLAVLEKFKFKKALTEAVAAAARKSKILRRRWGSVK